MRVAQKLGLYLVVATAATIILVCQWWSWSVDLSVPLSYSYDGLQAAVFTKGIIENGWYLVNPSLGMPDQMELYGYPLPTNLPLFLIKMISIVSDDYAIVLNLYFAMTFILTAMTSFYVLRKWSFHWFPAFIGSLLFAFQPYLIVRGWLGHIFLVSSFMIPLVALAVTKISLGHPWTKTELIGAIIIMLLVSAGSIYYSFFTMYFLALAGIYGWILRKNARPAAISALLICAVLAGTVINLLPSSSFGNREIQVSARIPGEADVHSLRLVSLLLPSPAHRISLFGQPANAYNKAINYSESKFSSLGILGAAGFLFLLTALLRKRPENTDASLIDALAFLNFAAILLATVGGVGSLIAHFFVVSLRGYARISIFIAFFSIASITFILDRVLAKHPGLDRMGLAVRILLILVLALGILDQTPGEIYGLENEKNRFYADAEFVKRVEAILPRKSMIFQLPDSDFPGGEYSIPVDPLHQAAKPYLHSQTLRWTYGALRGGATDLWQKSMQALPVRELVPALVYAGFSGIYIDREGYTDRGGGIETDLISELKSRPMESADKRQLLFTLLPRQQEMQSHFTPEEWEKRRTEALRRLLVAWSGGFYDEEKNAETRWRWCSNSGEMLIYNFLDTDVTARISMQLASRDPAESELSIQAPWFSEKLKLSNTPVSISRVLTIPPGMHRVTFLSNANSSVTSQDHRSLAFEVINYELVVQSK